MSVHKKYGPIGPAVWPAILTYLYIHTQMSFLSGFMLNLKHLFFYSSLIRIVMITQWTHTVINRRLCSRKTTFRLNV